MPKHYTISPARWIKPYLGRALVRACRVSGLVGGHGNGDWVDDEGRPWVDASIAKLIVSLNSAGYTTSFSCSGLRADHVKPGDLKTRYIGRGYIVFRDKVPKYPPQFVLSKNNGIYLGRDNTKLLGFVILTEEQKLAAWREFELLYL